MANSNFVVHNGLTVGPLTIDAATGAISTTGSITTTGASPRISQNASNVIVTESYVNVAVNGSNIISFGAQTTRIVGNLQLQGNLSVLGNVTTFSSNNVTFNDAMIYLADGNSGDVLDIGVVGAWTSGSTGYQHGGLVRDASDGQWKLFGNVVAEPTTTVDFTNAIYGNLRVNILTGTSTTAQYADLAEKYLADAVYTPGTVLDFGGSAEVTQSTEDMSVRVAGVVSTNPAHLMNNDLQGENTVALALTGRVPTRVVGPIHKGDMMVSNGDGRARAETLPRVGSIIGKALENFDGVDGVIEVVVGKH